MIRRLLLVAVAALAVAGCTPLTTSINNPLGLNESYSIEASVAAARRVGLEVMNTRQCRASESTTITTVCVKRSVKVQIQKADRKLTSVLILYRDFVDNNKTLNALSAATAVRAAISDYQRVVTSSGVRP